MDTTEESSTKKSRDPIHIDIRVVAYMILAVAAILGFRSLERANSKADDVAREAAELAEQVAIQTDQREQDLRASAMAGCQLRNTAQRNSRDRWVHLFDNLDVLAASGPGPVAPEVLRRLDVIKQNINIEPTQEDRDCNSDGQLTELDYTPLDQQGPIPGAGENSEPSSVDESTTTTSLGVSRRLPRRSTTTTTAGNRQSLAHSDVQPDPTVRPTPPPLAPGNQPASDPIKEISDAAEQVIDPICSVTNILGVC